MECKDCDRSPFCGYMIDATTMEQAKGEYHSVPGLKDWQDKKVEDMTEEQCREAVKELRKKLLTENKSAEENMARSRLFTDKEIREAIKENRDDMENVNHPSHYNRGMECIEEMIAVFGIEAVKNFCICNVWKYRYRASEKNGQEDLDKADWYMKKYVELSETQRVVKVKDQKLIDEYIDNLVR